jgi:exo-beta-1,3-glucanase (GH17 family)/cellulose synthase/poly-beta-1,6-N-acetylglucosamine synthase-like glycosyltransferase
MGSLPHILNTSCRRLTWSAGLLIAVVVVLNYFAWSFAGRHFEAPDAAARVNGLTYAPYARFEAPWVREVPLENLLRADLRQLAGTTNRLRTYSAAQFPQLPEIAAPYGLRLTLGAWLGKDYFNNTLEITAAVTQAAKHSNVDRLIIGNEAILKKILTVEQLVVLLRQARAKSRVPISTAEPWHVWIKHPELANEVDFITIHLLPYWEGVGLETAVEESLERLARVRTRFPNKPILIGEVGYPSSGDTIKRAVPSFGAQAAFVRQFVTKAASEKLDYFLIEAYDQPWKQTEEGRAGAYWGMFDAARQPKFAFTGVVQADPFWRTKAVTSSLAGLVFLLYFFSRLSTLRPLARVTFAVAAQGILSLATAIFTIPLLHYMNLGDWLVLTLIIPTSLIMVSILLAHLFEFAELFWVGNLRRNFQAKPLPANATEPKVSIHLACCNEPPAMVIATIASLQALDYKNFEVLVIDNNTQDETRWQPVRDYMATLPAHFRFFHLPSWPGYKAGALNFALEQTDSNAQVIAVVDADYVVRREWLRSLVAYFDDARVGVVQAPQAHRDWGNSVFRKMMNWEYEGFFRIGMHHRNERDAIIQHGTMTLIRAQVLRDFGRWSEWCMCEDAELGLRLMQYQLQTVYVDQVMGEGLTPDSFAEFKKQRTRWAQGGMQILRAHWRALLMPKTTKQSLAESTPDASTPQLTLSQRYHFLAGWLPWMGDALHLVFVIASLLWTVAVLVVPAYFSFPLALYMMPLAAFCAAKLVMGPLLYWRRVACSWKGIIGAAIAGMGLSHAIARGVIAGLLGRANVFQITGKGNAANTKPATRSRWRFGLGTTHGAALRSALSSVKEEAILFIALTLAITVVAVTREAGHRESLFWIGMLVMQCAPYLAAMISAAAASLSDQGEKVVAQARTDSELKVSGG